MASANPPNQGPLANTRTWVAATLAGLCVLAACVVLFFTVIGEILRVPELPNVPARKSAHAPMTEHLLLLIPDALRYDMAVDPQLCSNFARHMQQDTHGVLWAGRVTMTSAAVLSIGAGQRGDFAQIITNLNVRRVGYNDLFTNARSSGLHVALIGDVTWAQTFGDMEHQVVDENGIAIDVDNSPEMLAAAEEMLARKPNLALVHLIAPDHQGHAYGTNSSTYKQFLKRFDADLQRFLDRVPDDWTVLVFSDHGQTDTGAHGTDTDIMRKSPLFAYGRGIRRNVDVGDLDQVDLGYTIATLLGIAGPAHGIGTTQTALLDLADEQAASIRCADAHRVEQLASASGQTDLAERVRATASACNTPEASPQTKQTAALAAVREYEQLAASQQSHASRRATATIVLVGFASLAIPLLLAAWAVTGFRESRALRLAVASMVVAAIGVALTFYVERITPPYHNVVRAILFVAANGLMLWGLLAPSKAAQAYRKWPVLALSLLPGALAISYTANTQVEALVSLILCTLVWLFAPDADTQTVRRIWSGRRALAWWRIALAGLALVLLGPFGVINENPLPNLLATKPWLLLATSFALIGAWLVAGARERDGRLLKADTAIAIGAAIGAVLLRRVVPSWLGLTAMLVFPALAILAAGARRYTLAWGLGFAAYAWVSRDVELPAVVAAALVVEAVAQAAGPTTEQQHASIGTRAWTVATLVTVLFGAAFLARVSLQGGLDLTNIDYAAGSFGHPGVSQLRVFSSAVWKYASVMLLLAAIMLRPLGLELRRAVGFGFMLVFALRAATLAWILLACRSSYWSALRTLADLPSAIVTAAAASVVVAVVGIPARKAAPRASTATDTSLAASA